MSALEVAVVGCAHGELRAIYDCVAETERAGAPKVDLVICCGDFQAVRDGTDLGTLACPARYRHMRDFHRYYSGEAVAPVLTVFVGGNHEASNHLQALPLGGFVAPNIFYCGYAGVFEYKGITIVGVSGIHKFRDYRKPHWEAPPYTNDAMRSVYHVRKQEIDRLLQWGQKAAQPTRPRQPFLAVSHDWPQGVERHGDLEGLLARKPFLRQDVATGSLGSPPLLQLLTALRPDYWFAAHLHVKYVALVRNQGGSADTRETKFMALDKALPGRSFLQRVRIVTPQVTPETTNPTIRMDGAWTEILRELGRSSVQTPCDVSFANPATSSEIQDPHTQTEQLLLALGVVSVEDLFPRTVNAKSRPSGPSGPSAGHKCSDPNEIHLDL